MYYQPVNLTIYSTFSQRFTKDVKYRIENFFFCARTNGQSNHKLSAETFYVCHHFISEWKLLCVLSVAVFKLFVFFQVKLFFFFKLIIKFQQPFHLTGLRPGDPAWWVLSENQNKIITFCGVVPCNNTTHETSGETFNFQIWKVTMFSLKQPIVRRHLVDDTLERPPISRKQSQTQ